MSPEVDFPSATVPVCVTVTRLAQGGLTQQSFLSLLDALWWVTRTGRIAAFFTGRELAHDAHGWRPPQCQGLASAAGAGGLGCAVTARVGEHPYRHRQQRSKRLLPWTGWPLWPYDARSYARALLRCAGTAAPPVPRDLRPDRRCAVGGLRERPRALCVSFAGGARSFLPRSGGDFFGSGLTRGALQATTTKLANSVAQPSRITIEFYL